MTKITENFNVGEFDCHDGTLYPEEWIEGRLKPLCQALEKIRALTGGPLHILSGYRTPSWNHAVGGAKESTHMQGIAVDIQLQGIAPFKLYNAIEKLIRDGQIPDGGLGFYNRFVHYDQRPKRARWRG